MPTVTTPATMPRWLFIALSLLVLAGIVVAGWLQVSRPEAPRQLRLFYSDPQAMYLVPVDASLPMPSIEQEQAWAEALIGRMSQAPAATLVPVVTPGVKVLEADRAGAGWTIKLQVGSGFGSAMERLLVGGVVRSLVDSTPGATSVQLSLVGPDGQAWQSQHLDLSRPLKPADLANMLGDPGRGGLAATVWWQVAGTEALTPVRVPLVGQAGTPPADALVRLAAGPPAEAAPFLAGVAPSGVKPTWRGLEGEVATVDLATAPPEGAAGERFVAATALTLTEFEGVDAVRFTVQGAPASGMAGSFALGEPVERPDMVNPVSPEAWPTPEARP